jgi:hypothetical protein
VASSDEEFLVRVSFFQEIPEENQRAIIAARQAVLAASRAQVTALLAEIEPGPRTEWRARVMNHVLETIDDERTWIANLSKKAVSR